MEIETLDLETQLTQTKLEDFWRRRANRLEFQKETAVFGHRLLVRSNEEALMTAVDHAIPLYSKSPQTKPLLGQIDLVVQPMRQPPDAAPDDLMQQITYSGSDDWLMMQLGQWGQAHLDLTRQRGTAVLDPKLAARPELVSQCLLHTLILNLVIAQGYGMLHASCLVRDGVALLLLAPHNTGKSTTALRLALAGFPLLTDSMVFVDEAGSLHGFPVGIAKLRGDMVASFPELRPFLQTEVVRQETKYRVDLRAVDKQFVWETATSTNSTKLSRSVQAVQPHKVILCLLSRHDAVETVVEGVTETAVTQAILQNSLYEDQPHVWQQNMDKLQKLLVGETAVSLKIGIDPMQLIHTVTQLIG